MMQDEGEKPPKKRFIAGAVCPRCGQMDRIVNYHQNDKNYRECVACGFKDEIRLQSSPRELATRVHRPAGEDEIAVPVKIIQPSKKQT